jgi:LacI family transcriptional regulator
MKRYCLGLELKDDPALIAEYRRYHEQVWPEIQRSITGAGIRSMEIYLLGDRLFMVMETEDDFSFERKAAMDAANPDVQRWEQLMWTFQKPVPGSAPGEKWRRMERIFTLGSQSVHAAATSPAEPEADAGRAASEAPQSRAAIVYSGRMAVKMKDIADDLGISLVTVSKALRNHPDISQKTRERVAQRVRELGYRPNLAARSLVTGRSMLVGFVVPDLMHPFFAEIAKGLSAALRERGYFVVISSSEEDPELEQQEIEHMLAHRLDALVVASSHRTPESLRAITQSGTPLILLDRYFEGFDAHFVGSDDHSAGKLATEHLIEIGCKRIAHIQGPALSPGNRRLKGFLDTMRKHGLAVPPEYIVKADTGDVDGDEQGIQALRTLRKLKRPPDGVFCFNDVIASGVILEAVAQGIAVPRDLAVIGCGNLHSDRLIRVPLSSVDQRSQEIGRRTARLILDLLDAPESAQPIVPRRVVLQGGLVQRASTERVASARKATTAR